MTKAINRQYFPLSTAEEVIRPLKVLTAGGLAGAVSRTITAPLDRLKMLLMVHNGHRPQTVMEGVRQMLSEGSLKAMFKGNGTNVLKIAPETAIKLALNEYLKPYVVQNPENIHPAERVFCGGLAGAVAQITVFPLEVIKTRLATSRPGVYHGLIDATTRICHREGPFAFYRGIKPNMVGIFPYAGVDIACFEIIKKNLDKTFDENPPDILVFFAGTCSASVAQFIAYPFSLVKTRLAAQGIDNAPIQYHGMIDCFQKTLRKEGYRGLFKGLIPNFLKLAPAQGISWLVFEKAKTFLGLNGTR